MASAWLTTIDHGTYKVRWREGGKQRSTGRLHGRRAAEEALRAVQEKLTRQNPLSLYGQSLPLETILVRWQAARSLQGRMSPGYARESAREIRRILAEMGWATCRDVTQEAVDRWRSKRRINIIRPAAYLRAMLAWARKSLEQPVPVVDLSSQSPRRRVQRTLLTDEQAALILERAGRHLPLVHCLMTYGWRPSSAARICVGDVDLAKAIIVLRRIKSGDDLSHPLRPDTVRILRPLVTGRDKIDPLFLAPMGGGWRIDADTRAHQMSQWYRQEISYDFPSELRGIYDLKRYAITRLLRAAHGDPAAVAMITGHRSMSQVLIYARSNIESARSVVMGLG